MAVVFISCLKKLHGNYYGKDGSMMEEHSVNLLRECDSGCKMAAESLEQIRDMVSDQELWKDITESYEKHQKDLKRYGGGGKRAGENGLRLVLDVHRNAHDGKRR